MLSTLKEKLETMYRHLLSDQFQYTIKLNPWWDADYL